MGLVERIAYRPGAIFAQHLPAGGRLEGPVALHVDARAVGEVPGERLHRRLLEAARVGRIDERDVELLAAIPEPGERVGDHDLGRGLEEPCRLAQRRGHLAVLLHHHHARRPARERLEAERAAAGEEVHAGKAVQALAEPVEERFADTVWSGSQLRGGREADDAAAPAAADDANAIAFRSGHDRGNHTVKYRIPMALISFLRKDLELTRDRWKNAIGLLRSSPKIDEALYEALESQLIAADVGVAATATLIGRLRKAQRDKRIEDG